MVWRVVVSDPINDAASVSLHQSRARVIAVIAGLVGAVFAVITPLLPVRVDTAVISWPENNEWSSVSAPLLAYVANDVTISVPCSAASGLSRPGEVLLSTVPKQAPAAADRGLLIQRVGDELLVIVRNTPVAGAPLSEVLSPACERLDIIARADLVSATFVGLTHGAPTSESHPQRSGVRSGYDFRPQIVGVFTDLAGSAPAGVRFKATVDTRYSSVPTVLKSAVMASAVLCTVIALAALHRLDRSDGRQGKRVLARTWWRPHAVDVAVLAVLAWWHVVGANTSDDGYILTWARVSERAGYMANYYRWFGTPETPFGWYDDVLAIWAHISTSSVWMRLPSLGLALLCWWLLSREVIPRFGCGVRDVRVAQWTAAAMFLASWLPFNNGLRPEPVIAVGILLTWVLVERAVATGRLLPLALACITGALTLFSGPTGIAAVGALVVAVGPLTAIVTRRSPRMGYLAQLAPVLTAGVVTLILVFRDQTLMGVVQGNLLRVTVGPSLSWFEEYIRYQRLFLPTPDGAIARRFPVLAVMTALTLAVATMLHKNRIPGTASGPSTRMIGITVMSFAAIMFTPTKWTHHFGVFAGLAGGLGALAAAALTASAMASLRNRVIVSAVIAFILALSFSSVNGWWYVSNFGVPWGNSFPRWHIGISTIFVLCTAAALLTATSLHFATPESTRSRHWHRVVGSMASWSLAAGAWIVVLWSVVSLTAAVINQYPAFSTGRSNLRALAGHPCGLADDVLVETDVNAGMLMPVSTSVGDALGAMSHNGFTPNGIPTRIAADAATAAPGADSFVDSDGQVTGSDAGTDGGIAISLGVNGSRAQLPYALKPSSTPVLGSYRPGPQSPSFLRSGWYRLPPPRSDQPLIVVAVAGRFAARDVEFEFSSDGSLLGTANPADLGPAPAWRNLRLPRTAVPAGATWVRLKVTDDDLSPEQWIAVTPPRVPSLRALQDVVGSADPVFLDWLVGLAFPCQRPFGYQYGVAEVPRWRILPDRFGAAANSPVMDYRGGGPLGISELLFNTETLPSYLNHDWNRDWGSLERLVLRYPTATPAKLVLGVAVRDGLWSPAPLRSN